MSVRFLFVSLSVIVGVSSARSASAQTTPPSDPHAQHQPQPADPHAQHTTEHTMLFETRGASGTAWLPSASPMYAVQREAGRWQFMVHGSAFLQYLRESGDRGSDQTGSINWLMGMARRPVGDGRVGMRGMVSLEPWTIRGCGYPDLLATGEACDGEPIHDRQHPHDLVMELAAEYDRPLRGSVRWQLYAGLAGEPALGPVAYPHRLSAMPNPIAPIAHHWLDATHITFGVVTTAIYGQRWKVEGSAFNGREPDEHRKNVDLDALDSVSGRVWWTPTALIAVQVSAGHLREAEPGHDSSGPRVDVRRITASVSIHDTRANDGFWATTIAWGQNEEDGEVANAILAESHLAFGDRQSWFGRAEWAQKSAHDLDIHGSDDRFSVAKFQAGYARYFKQTRGLQPGIGASVSVGVVPRALEPSYGRTANAGVAVFLTLRPARHPM